MTPTLTVYCEYPDSTIEPTDVTFRISPRYGLTDAVRVHAWFLEMLRDHESFEVETDEPGELPMPFASETVRRVEVG